MLCCPNSSQKNNQHLPNSNVQRISTHKYSFKSKTPINQANYTNGQTNFNNNMSSSLNNFNNMYSSNIHNIHPQSQYLHQNNPQLKYRNIPTNIYQNQFVYNSQYPPFSNPLQIQYRQIQSQETQLNTFVNNVIHPLQKQVQFYQHQVIIRQNQLLQLNYLLNSALAEKQAN